MITGMLCLFFIKTEAQSSLKRLKQTNRFHYLQTNLHVGYLSETEQFDLSTSGPKNRLVYQYLAKNQRLLQKGYVRSVALSSFRSRFSLDFIGSLNDDSFFTYQLKLQNLGLSFATKWDRTSFFVGYSNIKLGHNPKIDPVTDFTANVLNLDLGFTQDLGVSFKTAISQKYDFEAALYTGGLLAGPLISYAPDLNAEQRMGRDTFEFIDPQYTMSWLGTSRIGSPLFKSFEYGLIAMAGKVGEGIEERYLTRIGADVVKKIKEKFKFESQVYGGISSYKIRNDSFDIALQNNIEFYIKSTFILSTSNAVLFGMPDNEDRTVTKGNLVNSFSYVVSPHTRVRLNHFYNYGNLINENWGITFQLVTGIGKR
ncbi:hypothetical protein GCM10022393_00850 [Aquimarina addita]|uniref:Phosphate-selective porin O/P n=2 Tax=Aquimarina addita TaxID=870485 RepID=A0ABP7X779_9FLAO